MPKSLSVNPARRNVKRPQSQPVVEFSREICGDPAVAEENDTPSDGSKGGHQSVLRSQRRRFVIGDGARHREESTDGND